MEVCLIRQQVCALEEAIQNCMDSIEVFSQACIDSETYWTMYLVVELRDRNFVQVFLESSTLAVLANLKYSVVFENRT